MILLFTVLLLCSAFFSAVEVAFVSLSAARVRALATERPGGATALVARLKSRPQHLLITILIGNNLVNIFLASLATVVATEHFGSRGLGIATGATTALILIFGEILPKGFAQRHAVGFVLASAYPIYLLGLVMTPITWAFAKIFEFVGHGQPLKTMTEEELVALVTIGTEEGEIKRHEREMIENVLEFTDTRVDEVMIPRVEIEGIERRATVGDAKHYFAGHSRSRLPVYDRSIDTVIGILTLRHVLEHLGNPNLTVDQLQLHKPLFVPGSRPIRSLFQDFKLKRTHMAIVVDEHGGTQGLVTLEDLLEEIVGEIEDEADIPEERFISLGPDTILAPADMPLWEVDEHFGTDTRHEVPDGKSLAFVILEKLGRLPRKREKVVAGDLKLTVEEVTENKIVKVKVQHGGLEGVPPPKETPVEGRESGGRV